MNQKTDIIAYKENPWVERLVMTLHTKNKTIGFAKRGESLINEETGEVMEMTTTIGQRKEVDTEEFVKFFAGGLRNVFQLSKTGYELFQVLITKYLETNTTNTTRADSITLNYTIANELFGYKPSERTFQRAMKELQLKEFLAPNFYSKDNFWVNPTFFIKGDRVRIVQEFHRKKMTKVDELEQKGQLRLGGV